jgi:Tfp pilus assembly protein PilO
VTEKLLRVREELGAAGLAALAVIAAVGVLHPLALSPMQARNAQLQARAAAATPRVDSATASGNTAHKVGAVYDFLRTQEQTTDWLAKLHGIGAATGLQMHSASYRTRDTEGPIVRYEVGLPVAGSYAQIRDFLNRAAAEIPVMSIDQLSLKRESRKAGALHAELRLTFHMVKE